MMRTGFIARARIQPKFILCGTQAQNVSAQKSNRTCTVSHIIRHLSHST